MPRSRPLRRLLGAVALLGAATLLARGLLGGGMPPSVTPPAHAQKLSSSPDATFDALVQRYLDGYLAFSPSSATSLGVHTYDHLLEDLSKQAIAREVARLKELQAALGRLQRPRLSPNRRVDADLLAMRLESDLLDLDEIQEWRRNPMLYNEIAAFSIYELLAKRFAPLEDRLRSVIARQRRLGRLFQNARDNLDNPPAVFTKKAIELVHGTVKFLREQVPHEAAKVNDPALLAEFRRSNVEAVQAAESYARWLRRDLLPRSKGSFALGAERFARKLAASEGVRISLDELEEIGVRELAATKVAFEQLARKIDAKKAPLAVLKAIEQDHGRAQDLIPDTARTLEGLRRFIIQKRIVSLPTEDRCQVVPMPDFMWGFAAMNTPGVFESQAREAYYYVDTVRPHWPKKKQKEHLEAFNRPLMTIVSIHEAYPGHFVQYLHQRRAPTLMRKLAAGRTFIEGWAHYTEQMLLDQGYGKGDDRLRLAQLRDALLRLARYLAAVRLHARGASLEDAVKIFHRDAYIDLYSARREAERGTYDPLYLVYTLGKLQIMKLRDDYRRKHPGATLQQFHDALLGQGTPPVATLRRLLLNEDAGKSL